MTAWTETSAMLGLLLLRVGIPLAVMVLVAWAFGRLDARWQAEADARRASQAVASGKLAPAAVKAALAASKPCWEIHGCSEEQRRNCPACQLLDLPCWMARLRTENRLPSRCYGCALFLGRRHPQLRPVHLRSA